jgi:signal transduction histidine kinase
LGGSKHAQGLFVKLPDFVRTTVFRWVSIAFAVCILLFSAIVYREAAAHMRARMDATIADESLVIAAETPSRQVNAIEDRLSEDPRRIKLAGVFGADGHRITGNLQSLPPGLVANATVQNAKAVRVDERGQEGMAVRAVARNLPNGNVLVIARYNGEDAEIVEVMGRALLIALPFAIGLSLVVGGILSARVQRRVTDLNALVRRIMSGNLRERIPVSGLDHPFDKLAVIANDMLDEIEIRVTDMAGVGNAIAHDLRTPLTRVRVGLERGCTRAKTLEELQSAADRAVGALDQSLTIITALLRIGEIENSRGNASFGEVALADLVREVGDFYSPMAEDKHVTLRVASAGNATAYCNRDLFFEAVANLVDNAVKFTPAGGSIDLSLAGGENETVIRVSDTGPGIGKDERDAVLRRFYRSDKSRNTPGTGLGLSLVSAIVRLHGFRLTLNVGAGCVAEIACPVPSNDAGTRPPAHDETLPTARKYSSTERMMS